MKRTRQQSQSLTARALAELAPEAQIMARRDAKYGGELDIGGAWLAHHDGLSSRQFCSRQRNARRLMSCGPDRLGALLIDHAAATIDCLDDFKDLNDPLEILAAVEAAESAIAACGGLDDALSKPNLHEVRAADHARACRIGIRRAQMVLRKQREIEKKQSNLFDDGEV